MPYALAPVKGACIPPQRHTEHPGVPFFLPIFEAGPQV
jgi:hypothetical protein